MIVRQSIYKPYLQHVEDYFARLLPILAAYQYSKGNGPIIAFQVENEYGSYGRYVFLKLWRYIVKKNTFAGKLFTNF